MISNAKTASRIPLKTLGHFTTGDEQHDELWTALNMTLKTLGHFIKGMNSMLELWTALNMTVHLPSYYHVALWPSRLR